MYNDEELNRAINCGIFSQDAVDRFRDMVAAERKTPTVDEENFRLVAGFNDIFVVIACMLSLFSASWAGQMVSQGFSLVIVPILAWCLGEYFIRKRRMALPAIVLLLFFVGGGFRFFQYVLAPLAEGEAIAAALSCLLAYAHWRRFGVPITVAAAMAGAMASFVLFVTVQAPSPNLFLTSLLVAGLLCFALAMYWDLRDPKRVTQKSDVAFWLHLLAAPMIVHPVFVKAGLLQGEESMMGMVLVIILYLFMTTVSLIINRRAFMVSSLLYVLYAVSEILKQSGFVSYSFAITGLALGLALLLLSAFWQKARSALLALCPAQIQKLFPLS